MLSTDGLRCLCRLSLTRTDCATARPSSSKAGTREAAGGAECWWQAEAAPSGLTSRPTAALQEA